MVTLAVRRAAEFKNQSDTPISSSKPEVVFWKRQRIDFRPHNNKIETKQRLKAKRRLRISLGRRGLERNPAGSHAVGRRSVLKRRRCCLLGAKVTADVVGQI